MEFLKLWKQCGFAVPVYGAEPRTTANYAKGKAERGVCRTKNAYLSVSERFPFATLRNFGVFRLFRGFNSGIQVKIPASFPG